jgi:hypothetical protein
MFRRYDRVYVLGADQQLLNHNGLTGRSVGSGASTFLEAAGTALDDLINETELHGLER